MTIFSENFLNEWRKLSQSVLIIQLHVACSPQTAIRYIGGGRLTICPTDDKAFISTYCFLTVNLPSSKDVLSS